MTEPADAADHVERLDRALAESGYPETLSTRQAGVILGCDPQVVRLLVRRGKLAGFMLNRKLRYRRRAVARYIHVNRAY